jgi:hypothetical protein
MRRIAGDTDAYTSHGDSHSDKPADGRKCNRSPGSDKHSPTARAAAITRSTRSAKPVDPANPSR